MVTICLTQKLIHYAANLHVFRCYTFLTYVTNACIVVIVNDICPKYKEEINMAARDGTGPMGTGPMTGRGLGPCNTGSERLVGYGYGRGGGMGFGPGRGRGMGFGPGRGCMRGFGGYGRGYGRGYAAMPYPEVNEKEYLEEEKKYLQNQLEGISKRLEDL
jgi:hypothetical protein